MSISFTLVIQPVGKRRARHGRISFKDGRSIPTTYKDEKQVLEEDKLLALLYSHRPETPMPGPIALMVRIYLPLPKSKSKVWKELARDGWERPVGKPDLDNLLKHFKDVCKGIFWYDDAQVVEYLQGTGKFYGDPPRWEVLIRTIHNRPSK